MLVGVNRERERERDLFLQTPSDYQQTLIALVINLPDLIQNPHATISNHSVASTLKLDIHNEAINRLLKPRRDRDGHYGK